jgi:glutathione S-transferase
MTEGLTLYDSRLSGNSWKVRLLLRQLERPFRRVTFDLASGATRTPEFLAKNPVGKVPVVETDSGKFLFESAAILAWLARGTPFLPDDSFAQAQVFQWPFFEQTEVRANLSKPRHAYAIAKNTAGREAEIAEWHRVGDLMLKIIDRHLASHSFFVADRYTIADIAHYPYISLAHLGQFDMDRYPNVQTWMKHVEAQPRYVPLVED